MSKLWVLPKWAKHRVKVDPPFSLHQSLSKTDGKKITHSQWNSPLYQNKPNNVKYPSFSSSFFSCYFNGVSAFCCCYPHSQERIWIPKIFRQFSSQRKGNGTQFTMFTTNSDEDASILTCIWVLFLLLGAEMDAPFWVRSKNSTSMILI